MATVPSGKIYLGKAQFQYLPKAGRWNKPFLTHQSFDDQSIDERTDQFGLTNNTSHVHFWPEGAFDDFGGVGAPKQSVFESSNKAYKGETVRFLCHMFFPAGYSFGYKDLNPEGGAGGGMVKFMRIQSYYPDDTGAGHIDIYVSETLDNQLMWIYEGEQQRVFFTDAETGAGMPTRDSWQSYQMTVTLDDVPMSENGMARVLIHKNGKLLADIQDHITMRPTAEYVKTYSFNPYWNGGCPQDQTSYVDEVVCTNITPTTTDAEGNFILESLTDDQPI